MPELRKLSRPRPLSLPTTAFAAFLTEKLERKIQGEIGIRKLPWKNMEKAGN
jgi:hypothetical protein